MEKEFYLTTEGATKIREELEQLTGPKRLELAKRLKNAVEMGDLSENADYIKAKEDQGFLEGRIQDLEYKLSNAVIIDQSNGKYGIVDLGVTVTVQEDQYPPETYLVVGATEADPRNGRISNESPIGRALMGHKIGDLVQAETPGGKIHLKIINIE